MQNIVLGKKYEVNERVMN